MKIYPRLDQEFKKKSSMDFQRIWGNVYKNRQIGNKVQGYLWVAFFFIGVFMGLLAFFLDIIVEMLTHLRMRITESLFH